MKKIACLFLTLTVLLFACKKNNDNKDWTEEDQAFYNNVITLQDQAGENYNTWLLTMDSMEVINKLQQFFLDDSTVTSAIIGSHGISVQYSNGLRGGIFLNPEDDFGEDSLSTGLIPKMSYSGLYEKSIVNIKKAIFLNPSYWERSENANGVIASYNLNLPKVGFSLQNIYKSMDVSVDRYTRLSGYGIIHIYSHGFPWPEKESIIDVYLMSGEKVNDGTSAKYWYDIISGNILIAEAETYTGQWNNVYWVSEDFVASHNDFSKDTVLFYGGFCYSYLGNWTKIVDKFAKGAYFGFTWRVRTTWNCTMAKSLIGSLTDTLVTPPSTADSWRTNPIPSKEMLDEEDGKFCRIKYVGDATLTLWKDVAVVETSPIINITQTTATGGGKVKSDGGFPVTARGVCWGTSSNPTIAGSHTSDGSGIGDFESNLSGLTLNTPYFLRAYATNSQETVYGNELTFTTLQDSVSLPTVSTYQALDITPTTASVLAKVETDGGSPVTERGVCWSNSSNPTTANDHTSDGIGTGDYTSSLTGLTPDTLYYFRAYATNSVGTAYGNQRSFSTPFEPFYIGQNYGGGIIFYIDDTERHGFICAPTDQSTGAQWGCDSTEIGGTSPYIGTGQANTTAILNGCSQSGIAAKICDDLELNGYNDWFLPSLEDLRLMYNERIAIGGISEASYWSSFESNAYYGYTQNFVNGSQYYIRKYEMNYVRAIRAF